MRFFVTGISGQLGHDVINEINRRGYEETGSDLMLSYTGEKDVSYATICPYVSLDITQEDKENILYKNAKKLFNI